MKGGKRETLNSSLVIKSEYTMVSNEILGDARSSAVKTKYSCPKEYVMYLLESEKCRLL